MLTELHMLNHPQYLWDEAYLIMVDYCFDVLLDSVCKNLVENLCIYVHKGYWSISFFVFVGPLCGLDIGDCGLLKRVRKFSFCFYFADYLRCISTDSSLMVW